MTRNSVEQKSIYFKEKVWLNIFVVISIIILEGVLVMVAIIESIKDPSNRVLIISLCSSIGLFLLIIFINYSVLTIEITEQELSVKYGIFSKKVIPLKNLQSVEKTSATFKVYLGFGIRIGLDGSIAYTTRFGTAVKFTTINDKVFVVTSNDPDSIIDFIEKMKRTN